MPARRCRRRPISSPAQTAMKVSLTRWNASSWRVRPGSRGRPDDPGHSGGPDDHAAAVARIRNSATKQGGCAMMKTAAGEARVFEDAEALARNAAEWLCGLALAGQGQFAISCSGGSTPKRLYEVLAEPAMASRFPWKRVHWFWGDEGFVPHDHPDSNYRMVFDALFSRVAVPERNIHAIPTADLSPEQAATAYERTLQAYYGADTLSPARPLFD